MTANESLLDSMISHAVYFERYKTHEVNQLLEVLDNANEQAKAVVRRTNGAATRKRYLDIMREIQSISSQARETMDKQLTLNLGEFVNTEIISTVGMINKAVGVNLDLTLPAPKQVYTAATFMPFASSQSFTKMLNDIDSKLYSTWDMSVRTGYLMGETAQQINRRVLGSVKEGTVGQIQALRRALETNTRTMISHYAEQARNSVYRENEDIFQGYQRIETLDTRTCLACGVEDGKIYKSLEVAPALPAHYGCRGLYLPILKGWEGLGITERASVDGAVPGNMTYEDWLRNQSEDRQRDILGPARYALFKNGASLKGFTSDGRTVNLSKWKEFEGTAVIGPKDKIQTAIGSSLKNEQDITKAGMLVLEQARKDGVDVFTVLKRYREFDSPEKHGYAKGSNNYAKDEMVRAQAYYPRDWITKSVSQSNRNPILFKKIQRGYYAHGNKPIFSVSQRTDCAVHELAHRMEAIKPEIVAAEKEFYNRRTAGEQLQYLRNLTPINYPLTEKARPDKFRDPYVGKDYGGSAYEILSMGIEKLKNHAYIKGDDDDFDSFIIGLLLGV